MAETYENTIIFDYFSFTTKIYDFLGIIKLLGLESIPHWEERKGRNNYKYGRYFDGIMIEWENTSCADSLHVEMSGQGCRNFETFSSCPDFNRLFNFVSIGEFKVTRLDVAYDDFDKIINFEKMETEFIKGHFVSKFGSVIITHEMNNERPCPTPKGRSIGYGSPKGDVYFRCYDKKLERKREDLEHWIRFEIQLRNDAADSFIANYFMNDSDVGNTFLGVLNNQMRYVKPSNDSNISRWLPARWWTRFVGEVPKIKLYQKKDIAYNLSGVQHYVIEQAGNSLEVLKQTIGIDKVLELLAKRDSELQPKQQHLIDEYIHQQIKEGSGFSF